MGLFTPHIMFRISLACQVGIALCWLWAGCSKLLDPDGFRGTLAVHALIPQEARTAVAWSVPGVELGLGVGLILFGLSRRWSFVATLLSAGALVVFTIYVLRVSDAALQSKGCGCMGLPKHVEGGHAGPVERNALLLCLHPFVPLASRLRGSFAPRVRFAKAQQS